VQYDRGVASWTEAEACIDWTVIEHDSVQLVARQAASKVARNSGGVLEYDDLYQDALIILASRAEVVRDYLSDPATAERHLNKWLWSRLEDKARTHKARAARNESYEALLDRYREDW